MYTSYRIEELDRIFSVKRSVYFIGIGGISMSSLAHIALEHGCRVGGYDRTPSSLTKALEASGAEIFYEISPDHLDTYDVIVYTAAIKPDHPELARALACDGDGSKFCVYRADFLGWLMSAYENRIGVSGMHGKSTTTSMIAQIFLTAERDPTIVSGAELDAIGGAYRVGSHRDFIMEACEYQDSFLSFTPNIAVVLNIDLDHLDYFSGLEQILSSFSKYLAIASDGYAVLNADSDNVLTAADGYRGKKITFALDRDADYTAENLTFDHGRASFSLLRRGEKLADIKLKVAGRHCVSDALAAAAVADLCGIPAEKIAEGLAAFTGAKRRMEFRGRVKGLSSGAEDVPLYDDYAHHPTEIKATLSAASELGYERVFAVFQPHTYSRTAELFDEFACAFRSVHAVFADIYAAREINTFGVSSEKLAKAAGGLYFDSFEKIADYLKSELRTGDLLLIMGAGDIIGIDRYLL